jgi:energy-coupling factor transport system ATP-binding protein
MKIQVNSLNKIFNQNTPFQVQALAKVSFSISNGEIIGIIGPSGGGKSCLLHCLAGVIAPTTGLILRDLDPLNRPIGLVIQEPEQQFFLETVYDEVGFALSEKGLSSFEIENRIVSALAQVNYQGDLQKSPFRVSGGEKRRIALASILVMDPFVLMLDEPTAGLDDSGLLMIRRVIQRYRELKRTLLIVSHDLDFLYSEVDRFLLLEQGALVADFEKKDFLDYVNILSKLGVGIPEKIALIKKNPPQFIREILTES